MEKTKRTFTAQAKIKPSLGHVQTKYRRFRQASFGIHKAFLLFNNHSKASEERSALAAFLPWTKFSWAKPNSDESVKPRIFRLPPQPHLSNLGCETSSDLSLYCQAMSEKALPDI